jgi:hypothetical protein
VRQMRDRFDPPRSSSASHAGVMTETGDGEAVVFYREVFDEQSEPSQAGAYNFLLKNNTEIFEFYFKNIVDNLCKKGSRIIMNYCIMSVLLYNGRS